MSHDDLASLKSLQQLLFREIIRTEKKIRQHKAELRGVQENGGERAPKRSSYLKNRIEGYRECAYVWRCFGDAIAFLYMDKHALKQVFYNVDNLKPRNDAGFLAGKEGAANEIAYLEYALEKEVPALLTDLTNTIRHGDVCLMGRPDPYLIEVKTSGGLDRRGRRQRDNLEKLHKFFETDRAEGLRGLPGEIRRQEHQTPERNYVEEMNDCIDDALKTGFAMREPEPGVHYIAVTDEAPSADEILRPLKLKAPWIFFLNGAKSN